MEAFSEKMERISTVDELPSWEEMASLGTFTHLRKAWGIMYETAREKLK